MHFNDEDENLFDIFVMTRNIKEKTQEGYKRALEQYMTITDMHLSDLMFVKCFASFYVSKYC